MKHTPQIKKAIQFAARKHHGHFRAEKEPLPYITHLFSAALLVGESGADEEVVIATLLHDTIEDTETTREEIAAAFGEKVAGLVEVVSEPSEEAGHKLEWKEKKKRYLAQIELGSDEALIISLADKIDNLESKLELLEHEGFEATKRWKQPPEDFAWFNSAVLHIAQERLPHHPLTKRLAELHERERAMLSGS